MSNNLNPNNLKPFINPKIINIKLQDIIVTNNNKDKLLPLIPPIYFQDIQEDNIGSTIINAYYNIDFNLKKLNIIKNFIISILESSKYDLEKINFSRERYKLYNENLFFNFSNNITNSFKTQDDFKEFVNQYNNNKYDLLKNNNIENFPFFIKIFQNEYQNNSESKTYFMNLFKKYLEIRAKLIKYIKTNYGLLAFKFIFDLSNTQFFAKVKEIEKKKLKKEKNNNNKTVPYNNFMLYGKNLGFNQNNNNNWKVGNVLKKITPIPSSAVPLTPIPDEQNVEKYIIYNIDFKNSPNKPYTLQILYKNNNSIELSISKEELTTYYELNWMIGNVLKKITPIPSSAVPLTPIPDEQNVEKYIIYNIDFKNSPNKPYTLQILYKNNNSIELSISKEELTTYYELNWMIDDVLEKIMPHLIPDETDVERYIISKINLNLPNPYTLKIIYKNKNPPIPSIDISISKEELNTYYQLNWMVGDNLKKITPTPSSTVPLTFIPDEPDVEKYIITYINLKKPNYYYTLEILYKTSSKKIPIKLSISKEELNTYYQLNWKLNDVLKKITPTPSSTVPLTFIPDEPDVEKYIITYINLKKPNYNYTLEILYKTSSKKNPIKLSISKKELNTYYEINNKLNWKLNDVLKKIIPPPYLIPNEPEVKKYIITNINFKKFPNKPYTLQILYKNNNSIELPFSQKELDIYFKLISKNTFSKNLVNKIHSFDLLYTKVANQLYYKDDYTKNIGIYYSNLNKSLDKYVGNEFSNNLYHILINGFESDYNMLQFTFNYTDPILFSKMVDLQFMIKDFISNKINKFEQYYSAYMEWYEIFVGISSKFDFKFGATFDSDFKSFFDELFTKSTGENIVP